MSYTGVSGKGKEIPGIPWQKIFILLNACVKQPLSLAFRPSQVCKSKAEEEMCFPLAVTNGPEDKGKGALDTGIHVPKKLAFCQPLGMSVISE